ncbi:MAG: phage portal protein [Novosphingobium sp.]
MNALDRIFEAVAPQYAAKRISARRRIESNKVAIGLVRAYEGAAKGRRTEGWRTIGSSANTETRRALPILRDRSRDLVRNNPYAARAVNVIAANLVGYGIKTTIRTRNKKASKPLQSAWVDWAESTQCDAAGQHDLYGLQELAARTIIESGEVLMRRIWRKPGDGLAVPLQLQVLEPDYIDTGKDGEMYNGNEILQGIEYDKQGRRAAYWLFDTHPGDAYSSARTSYTSKRIPAADILHVYRMDRAGQVRGVPWFAPVILRMRDLDEYEDAQIVRQKIAACFAAFVHDMEVGEDPTGNDAADLTERLEPGAIQRLPAGTNVTLANPPTVQGYGEYMSVTLHAIAAGLGLPYESLTGDYSQVNFTSGRMGRSEFHALLDVWQWKMLVPQMCGGVFGWFLEAAVLAGLPAQGATARYVPPRRVLVDPTREIPAQIKAIRGGLQTLFGGIREMGYEPAEFLAEVAEGNALMDSLGLVLDSDARKVSQQGMTQARPDGTVIPGTDIDDGSGAGDDAPEE